MNTCFLSEIFLIQHSQLNLDCFRLSPEIGKEKEIGNRFSWEFSKQFKDIAVVYDRGLFWVLGQPNKKLPSQEEWKKALETIQDKLIKDLGDRLYFIQFIRDFESQIDATVIAQLVVTLLKINRIFSMPVVFPKGQVKAKIEVKRKCDFWAETIELQAKDSPAITLTVKSRFFCNDNLEQFFIHHPERNNPEKLLIDLKVEDIETNNTATIVKIAGTIGEHRMRLLEKATGSTSKEKLLAAPDNQPVVTIQFGKKSQQYDYAMAALRPSVTRDNSKYLGVDYEELSKHKKISYQERQQLLVSYKNEAIEALRAYNLTLAQKCINSSEYRNLFWTPSTKLEDTPILFGNKIIEKKGATLKGLSQGGVYRRHGEFNNTERKIRIAALKFCDEKVASFIAELQKNLQKYRFNSILPEEQKKHISLAGLSESEKRATIEKSIEDILQIPCDIVLVFLPQSDRNYDDSDGDSLYCLVSSRLLRRKISSQVIYEDTLKKSSSYRNILNNIVPGILAKLGNLPFILANPLEIADCFIGLDISRQSKKKLPGSLNCCASMRLYGKQGEFIIRYQLPDNLIEGEEIPARILRDFLPQEYLKNKRVLLYRDGSFRGDEIKHILEWGQAINTQFILVECFKSRSPRLYNLKDKSLTSPIRGLALKISSQEAIVLTTQTHESVGVPRPLRLRVRNEGLLAPIEDIIDTTLKLTLLHHGSLKDPRLPIPLFGSDLIAYRRLQGIYPGELEGDKQYWL
jgi:hypothetical protein